LLYEDTTIHNGSNQFVSCVYFFFVDFAFHPSPQTKSDLCVPTSNSCIFTPTENWTQVYMNLFTQSSPYYHLLIYLLFLLKQPVCMCVCVCVYIYIYIYYCAFGWCSTLSTLKMEKIFSTVCSFIHSFSIQP
jgi:hypothetical protein